MIVDMTKLEQQFLENKKAKAKTEREKLLKEQQQEAYAKEQLECPVCKRMIQRKCMHEHQKTKTCQRNGLLLDETQKELHEQALKDKQYEHCKKYYEKNKEQIIAQQSEKIQCSICNSMITRNKMIRHQKTDICKKKALLLNASETDKETQLKQKQQEYFKRYYESNKEKVMEQHCEKIPCNLCQSMVCRSNLNRHQLTDICKRRALLLNKSENELLSQK